MKKALAVLTLIFVVLSVFTGCSSAYKDGSYHAEFSDFDEHGWKEYVDVTVTDGKVSALIFDGVDADGNKKSEDETYRSDMDTVEGTYPAKFYADITNQYLEAGKLKDVATVAGATVSTGHFQALMGALETNFSTGDTTVRIVDSSTASKSK